jgi:hypothetical protein
MASSTATPAPVKPYRPRKPTLATKPAAGWWRWACQPGTGRNAHDGVLVTLSSLPVCLRSLLRASRLPPARGG